MMISAIIAWVVATTALLHRKQGVNLRQACLGTFLTFFLVVVVSTEILSLFSGLTFSALALLWSCLLTITLVLLVKGSPKQELTTLHRQTGTPREYPLFVVAIVVIAAVNLLVSLLAPPNNWDSMTYHMSRVAHWIQNQGAGFYPTSIGRQNHSMPLAEFSILHLQLLSASDRFANLVQWCSYIVCILTTTLIARQFTRDSRTEWFAGLFAATLPMAILQSTSSQNDLVTSAFCLLFLYHLLRFIKTHSNRELLFGALSLGLALLTKGTAYIFCAAIGASLSIWALFALNTFQARFRFLAKLLVLVTVALLINTGHYARNYSLYGNPLSTETGNVRNQEITLEVLAANMARNTASQLGTPLEALNGYLGKAVLNMIGDQDKNLLSTFGEHPFKVVFFLNEDHAGNFLHFILILLALFSLYRFRAKDNNVPAAIAVCCIVSFLLFSALLKWQPWGSRLLTPFFLMAAPFVAKVFTDKSMFSLRVQSLIVVALIAFSLPFTLMNNSRPLVLRHGKSLFMTPRAELYFANRPEIFGDYRNATSRIDWSATTDIGLVLSEDQWEYPLWVSAKRHASKGRPQIRHISVNDLSKGLDDNNKRLPDVLLIGGYSRKMTINGERFEAVYSGEQLSLLALEK